jgi:hypothetical protein
MRLVITASPLSPPYSRISSNCLLPLGRGTKLRTPNTAGKIIILYTLIFRLTFMCRGRKNMFPATYDNFSCGNTSIHICVFCITAVTCWQNKILLFLCIRFHVEGLGSFVFSVPFNGRWLARVPENNSSVPTNMSKFYKYFLFYFLIRLQLTILLPKRCL